MTTKTYTGREMDFMFWSRNPELVPKSERAAFYEWQIAEAERAVSNAKAAFDAAVDRLESLRVFGHPHVG